MTRKRYKLEEIVAKLHQTDPDHFNGPAGSLKP